MGQSSIQKRYQIIKVEGCIMGKRSVKPLPGRCAYCGMPKKSMIEEKKLMEKVEDIKAYLTELKDDKNESDKRKPRETAKLNQVLIEINTLEGFLNESAEYYYMLSHEQVGTNDKSKCKEVFFKIEKDENDPLDIVFNCNITETELPSDHETLYKSAANANTIIKSLKYTDDNTKKHYIDELRLLANVGLGEKNQPKLATGGLDILKTEIVKIEGPKIKNKYMMELGKQAIMFTIITLLVLAFQTYVEILKYFSVYLYVWIGAMAGVWISFGARKMTIEFEQLNNVEEDMMYPWIRLVFVGIISIIFFALIKYSIITFDIVGFKTQDILAHVELQIIFGIICGLIESKLAINIYDKAGAMVNGNKKKSS